MVIYVDIDNTITETIGTDYNNARPIFEKIEIINNLFDAGHHIVYWTARGSLSKVDYTDLTSKQLKEWGAKHHELLLGKPAYDLFIDDKNLNEINKNIIEWVVKREGN
jgi:CMP-N,N'-diacetyllegionaminic acid synthase